MIKLSEAIYNEINKEENFSNKYEFIKNNSKLTKYADVYNKIREFYDNKELFDSFVYDQVNDILVGPMKSKDEYKDLESKSIDELLDMLDRNASKSEYKDNKDIAYDDAIITFTELSSEAENNASLFYKAIDRWYNELKSSLSESTKGLTESDESSPLKNVAEVIKRIIAECNGKISYVDYYTDSINIKAKFKAENISRYENDITLYGNLKFDNDKLTKSDLTTSSGPNVLNNDYIKCLNALYGYLVSGNSGYDL